MRENLNVKVGDELYIPNRYSCGHIIKVDRITPSGRIIAGNTSYDPNGRERATRGSWGGTVWAIIATDKHRADIARVDTLSFLERFTWDKLTDDQLKSVLALVKQS